MALQFRVVPEGDAETLAEDLHPVFEEIKQHGE